MTSNLRQGGFEPRFPRLLHPVVVPAILLHNVGILFLICRCRRFVIFVANDEPPAVSSTAIHHQFAPLLAIVRLAHPVWTHSIFFGRVGIERFRRDMTGKGDVWGKIKNTEESTPDAFHRETRSSVVKAMWLEGENGFNVCANLTLRCLDSDWKSTIYPMPKTIIIHTYIYNVYLFQCQQHSQVVSS